MSKKPSEKIKIRFYEDKDFLRVRRIIWNGLVANWSKGYWNSWKQPLKYIVSVFILILIESWKNVFVALLLYELILAAYMFYLFFDHT